MLRVRAGEPASPGELGGLDQGLFPASGTAYGPGPTPSRGDHGGGGEGTAVQILGQPRPREFQRGWKSLPA